MDNRQRVNLIRSAAPYTIQRINPNWREDTCLRLKTEDWLKNAAFNNGVPAITNGDEYLAKSVSVSQIALDSDTSVSKSVLHSNLESPSL